MLSYKTRDDFIRSLPHNAIVAEIGVCKGHNAERIIRCTNPKELHLIDMWKNIYKEGDAKEKTKDQWEFLYQRCCKLGKTYRMSSIEASKLFNDEYFDWIYIDAGHSYDSCLSDLEAWYPKVKNNGFISGHDYTDSQIAIDKNFGVKKAVDDFCKKHSLTILALSECLNEEDYVFQKRV